MSPAMRNGLSIAVLTLVAPWLSGQEAQDPGRVGVDTSEPPVELSSSQRDAILNKPRIAEETRERLVGLREAGNPHIRKGILLERIQDNPEGQQVDQEKLRAEAIRRIENREGLSLTAAPEGEASALSSEVPHSAPPPSNVDWIAVALGAAALGAVIAGVRLLRSGPH